MGTIELLNELHPQSGSPADHAEIVAVKGTWIPRLMACLGVATLMAGIVLFARQMLFARSAMSSVGTVVEMVYQAESPGIPLVEFVAHDGQVVRFQGVASTPGPARGDTVAVLYDRADIHNAKIDSFMQRWFVATLLSAWGAAFIVLPRYISPTEDG